MSTPTINNNKEKWATVDTDNQKGKVRECQHRQSTTRKSERMSTPTIYNKEKWANVNTDNQQGKVCECRHRQSTPAINSQHWPPTDTSDNQKKPTPDNRESTTNKEENTARPGWKLQPLLLPSQPTILPQKAVLKRSCFICQQTWGR